MKISTLLVCFLSLFTQCGESATPLLSNTTTDCPTTARMLFWNVENLFDTIDHSTKLDEEFTPGGSNQWNGKRYQKKLKNLSEVIAKILGEKQAIGIGLCEIENRKVLEDLVATEALKPYHLKIVHEESADRRGIDVAFLYSSGIFIESSHEVIRPSFPTDPEYTSRDVLYVKGKSCAGNEMHVFVNHWPSRRDGEEISESRRLRMAELLHEKTSSILEKDKNAAIFCMGDWNDEPFNKSLREVLQADGQPGHLTNLMANVADSNGTITYKGEWNVFDQFLVSPSLLDGKGMESDKEGKIFKDPMVLYYDKTGQAFPNKTYGGTKYYGGYSDHLAIWVDLNL